MEPETELVFYAKVGDYRGLLKAKKIIEQEQVQIKADLGRIRVRMERLSGEPEYKYNMLTKHAKAVEGVQATDESHEVPITAEIYELFKSVNQEYMRKVRYVFDVEKIKIESEKFTGELEAEVFYEVDRFIMQNGHWSDWVKIDIEIDKLLQAMKAAGLDESVDKHIVATLSKLPFKPTAVFYDDRSKSGPMRDLVSEIYDKQFIRRLSID